MNKEVSHIKQTGATFTPTGLADFLAEKLLSYHNGKNLKVLDPACGDGALLMAISNVLQKRNLKFELHGYDLNNDYLSVARQNLRINNNINNANLIHANFLEIIDLKRKQLSFFDSIENSMKTRMQSNNQVKYLVIALFLTNSLRNCLYDHD